MISAILSFFRELGGAIFHNPYMDPALLPMNAPDLPAPVTPPTLIPVPIAPPPRQKYLWDTQEHARYSVRVLCDEAGLPLVRSVIVNGKAYFPKDVIAACIYQESNFWNILPNGKPVMGRNFSKDNPTVLLSTDWGICQFNDTKGWYIGAGLPFPTIEYLLNNPTKAVQLMIEMYKNGQLGKWVSYSSGAYKRWLPYVSTPVPASGRYGV